MPDGSQTTPVMDAPSQARRVVAVDNSVTMVRAAILRVAASLTVIGLTACGGETAPSRPSTPTPSTSAATEQRTEAADAYMAAANAYLVAVAAPLAALPDPSSDAPVTDYVAPLGQVASATQVLETSLNAIHFPPNAQADASLLIRSTQDELADLQAFLADPNDGTLSAWEREPATPYNNWLRQDLGLPVSSSG